MRRQGQPRRRRTFSLPAASCLHPIGHVGRHSNVHQLRIRQVQLAHELHKLIPALGEPWVELPLLADRGQVPALVVMPRVDPGGIREAEEAGVHHVVELAGVPLLEVRPPASADQQRVPCEGSERLPGAFEHEGHATVGVTRGGQGVQGVPANGHLVTVPQLDVCSRPGGFRDYGPDSRPQLLDCRAGSDVICMAMGIHHVLQFEAKLAEEREVPPLHAQDRIDQDRLVARCAADKVREG
mmetsp:Transcript_145922/g.406484  ORF Transcript_145922/g.406484 Transcript_145922/m.406484 type:complete len:240 (-) Transcript_145922:2080-2799(-)